ncbi:MAG: putative O-glycosylation ligase, exosortase A system-associated [Aromatoleum sp.]|nr:putative O-glycosylation ligase, exosortase A system-associated [Aromatoleum sp.]
MRDYALTAFIFGSIPFILWRPWIGALMWVWIGLMNPHRLTWNFAFNMPFAQVVAIATLVGMLFSGEKFRIPWSPPVKLLFALVAWMSVSTYFAIDTTDAFPQWQKVMKIQFMTFIVMMLIADRKRLEALVWVAALSLAFYGVKGGIYTFTGGGSNQVLGPEGSFIEGNTEIGLALVMALPLVRVMQMSAQRRAVRWALGLAMLLTGLAILGTQSRGAFLGAAAMAIMLWIKSRKKAMLFVMLIAAVPALLVVMPDSWFTRMEGIGSYEQDRSAMGRLYAWEFAFRMAVKHPLVGGGFASFTPENYAVYAPDLTEAVNEKGAVADAHSVYFQVLGHHGFVGLAIFLALLAAMWQSAARVMRATRAREDLRWAYDTAAMSQVSLVGFMVAGAFLGLAYFDLLYTLLAIIAITESLVRRGHGTIPAVASTADAVGAAQQQPLRP